MRTHDIDLQELAIVIVERAPALAGHLVFLAEYLRWRGDDSTENDAGQTPPLAHAEKRARDGMPPSRVSRARAMNSRIAFIEPAFEARRKSLSGGLDRWLFDAGFANDALRLAGVHWSPRKGGGTSGARYARVGRFDCVLRGCDGQPLSARIAHNKAGRYMYYCSSCLGKGRSLGLPEVLATFAVGKVQHLTGMQLVVWTARLVLQAGYEDVPRIPLPPSQLAGLDGDPPTRFRVKAVVEGFELLSRCWRLIDPPQGKLWLVYTPGFVNRWCGFNNPKQTCVALKLAVDHGLLLLQDGKYALCATPGGHKERR